MIVVDATTVVNGLLRRGASRRRLQRHELHTPHLADSEVVSTLTRLVRAGRIERAAAERALTGWAALGVRRYPVHGLLSRMWALRENVKAYDATYVALAEILELPLVTGDQRLARAPGVRCEVVVVGD